MTKHNLLKGLFALFILSYTYSFASSSKIDELVETNKIKELVTLIKETKIIGSETDLPDNPKNNELIIIENEYDIKVLFEYVDDTWSEKSGKLIAEIMNDQKSTYMHLFNYKVSNKDFNPYTSDKESLKTTETDRKIEIKFLDSKFNEQAISSTVKVFTQKNLIAPDDIISIQIIPEQTSCKIILSYKE